jgi:hypothetical protein
MATTRIKDLTTASAMADDDYIAIDGATNGTRKIAASDVGGGGETLYDFTSSLTPSIDNRGVSGWSCMITPQSSAALTVENGREIQAYLAYSATQIYPLILTTVAVSSTYFTVTLKSIFSSTQSTSSTTVSGTLHIVAPFQISRISSGM